MVELLFGSGWILHLLLIAILYLMLRSARTLSLSQLIKRDAVQHHINHQYHLENQHGGNWSNYQSWLQKNKNKSNPD